MPVLFGIYHDNIHKCALIKHHKAIGNNFLKWLPDGKHFSNFFLSSEPYIYCLLGIFI